MAPWEDEDRQDGLARIAREIERRRLAGEPFVPVPAPSGKKLASKFWGQAWQHHLESYADYESRLPRGRSYLRNGAVYDLDIKPGMITAVVAGQHLYEVIIKIKPLDEDTWNEIKTACAGQIGSLLDLLSGKIGDGVMKIITDREAGLFPSPREIKLSCTCPDWADVCKHCAAVLYGVGLTFDAKPETFFTLRGVDHMELLISASSSLSNDESGSKIIPDSDIAALFGIELDDGPESG